MLEPKEFRNIIHQYFTEVTSQEFLANQKNTVQKFLKAITIPISLKILIIQQNSTNLKEGTRKLNPLYLQALAIAEQALGENHPATVKIRENLQTLRQQQHPSS